MKKLRVTVQGKVYEVLVESIDEGLVSEAPPAPAPLVESPPHSTPPLPSKTPVVSSSNTGKNIASPLAGKIVSVDVQPGQLIEEGAQVLTIEAMKMNTYVFSEMKGQVATILVSVGDAVEEGQVLITMK